MADLKTNYQDDILNTSVNTKRKYNMINNADGTVSFEDVSVYTQEGDTFGAVDVNQATTAINANTNALNGVKLSYNTSDGHFYAQKGSTTKKLGSGEGTATTSQVLDGATFTSEQYEDIATGTMPNRGKWIGATTNSGNITIPEGYHNGEGYVSGKGAYDAGIAAAKIPLFSGNVLYERTIVNNAGLSPEYRTVTKTYEGIDKGALSKDSFVLKITDIHTKATDRWDNCYPTDCRITSYNSTNGIITIQGTFRASAYNNTGETLKTTASVDFEIYKK